MDSDRWRVSSFLEAGQQWFRSVSECLSTFPSEKVDV